MPTSDGWGVMAENNQNIASTGASKKTHLRSIETMMTRNDGKP